MLSRMLCSSRLGKPSRIPPPGEEAGGEGGVVSQLDEPHRKGGCKEELRAALSKQDRSC